jgi:hypothetical protein
MSEALLRIWKMMSIGWLSLASPRPLMTMLNWYGSVKWSAFLDMCKRVDSVLYNIGFYVHGITN